MPARALVAALLVLHGTACGGDGTGRSTDAAEMQRWNLDEQPFVVVGLEERTPSHLFQRVADATYLDDGAIAMLEAGRREVRVFDAEGDLVWVAGGEGDGPGEFSSYVSVLRQNADGAIVVSSGDNRALVVFDASGAYSHTERVDVANPLQPVTRLYPPFADGAVAVVRHPMTLFPTEPGFERYSGVISITMIRADSVESRFQFPAAETFAILADGRSFANNLPFVHVPAVAVGGNFIAAGITSDSITLISSEGDRWNIPVQFERKPVDAAQIERFLTLHEATSSEFEEVLARVAPPDSTPRFDQLVVDSEDRIWVRRYSLGGATTWEVLDSAGARLARVRLPPEVRVMDARNDEVLLLHRTDLDVEYLARWAFQR